MASTVGFQARIGALTDQLVESVTQVSPQDKATFSAYRESAVRGLRHHNFLRTNQFDVQQQLDGLEERFRVCHREGLGDALRERLDELATAPSKWHPDILQLLLELSDQPTQKTRLEDLDDPVEPEAEAPPSLRWEDIAKEDGWERDADIWKRPDFSGGSDDETYQDGNSTSSSDSEPPAIGALLDQKLQSILVTPQDYPKRNRIREAQDWRWAAKSAGTDGRALKKALSGLQVAREALFMLHGLSTTLFPQVGLPDLKYQMSGVEWGTYMALITSFAEMGRRLGIVREFAKQTVVSPHAQVFQQCVKRTLRDFGQKISAIEARLISNRADVVVSLPAIQEELRAPIEPLYCLSDMISTLQETGQGPFRHLELLFDEIGLAQGTGKPDAYRVLGQIFFDCFKLYLEPIRLWMEEGELVPGDKVFFVSEASTPVGLNQAWQLQYRLRRTQGGSLHAPSFLHPAATKIFTAGKSVVVLKHLGKYESAEARTPLTDGELKSAFGFILKPQQDFMPFAQLFDDAFDQWIKSKHKPVSARLKDALFNSCGLWSALDALRCLFLMSDGSLADAFCLALFKKLDSLNQGWRDRYALTALIQEIYSSSVDTHRLSVTLSPEGQRLPWATARDGVRNYLPEVSLAYNLGWPVQMISTSECMERYRAMYTFLLQLRRAHYVLHKQRLMAHDATDGDNWVERGPYYHVRSRLLWFCNTFRTYLTGLVLAPQCARLRSDLAAAHDVDAIIQIHAAFTKEIIDEACLGSRLQPLRECVLDILDLAMTLDRAQALAAARDAEEMQELSRLSVMSSSPPKMEQPPKREAARRRRDDDDDSDGDEDEVEDLSSLSGPEGRRGGGEGKSFIDTVLSVNAAYERHLQFVTEGLRSVARATGDSVSSKWDMLAEMLEAGLKSGRQQEWT